MSGWTAARGAVVIGACALSGVASAQSTLTQRCDADILSPSRAAARVEWMRRCALTKLRPTDHVGGEYTEPSSNPVTGKDAYIGPTDEFGINATYINLLYIPGPTTVSVDANGYYKWTKPRERVKARPRYPTYGSQSDINTASPLFPHSQLATCELYGGRGGPHPFSFYVNGFCEAAGTQLTSGSSQSVSGATASTTLYALEVPPGASRVLFEANGGTGDVDLYVRFNAAPTLSAYDCRPYLGGNTEGCNMPSPAAGTWFVMLHGYAAYSGVTLKATVY